ncbi:variable large family protein [Borrelia crocidurae]|nr:variable large family protein [Borrelia crocidurae]
MGRIVRGIVMVLVMMVMVMGCNSGGVAGGEGKVDLAKKNSFLESLVKIGEGFQEIFSGFGSAVGDAFGFTVVKSNDKRSKVGEHFKAIGDGLKTTKDKLNILIKEISSTPYADIIAVESVIKSASEIIVKLFDSVNKLAEVTKEGNVEIGDVNNAGAVAADKASVEFVIEGVKTIIDIAESSGVKIEKGNAGNSVANGNGPKLLAHNADASADASKFAAEVVKADPWAMIDKIKNATAGGNATTANAEVGALALGGGSSANDAGTAKTNADLAAAVALKAMTKSGKFSANDAVNADISGAAASAVNKVLGILDIIIRQTVESNLDKIREAVKGIKYSETSGVNSTKSDTAQVTTTK